MNQPSPKQFYIRRRDKSFGPFSEKQLQSGKQANQFREADLVSENVDGPWISISRFFSEMKGNPSSDIPPVPVKSDRDAPEVVMAQVVQTEPARPSSAWKYALAVLLGMGALGTAGLIGVTCLLVALFMFVGSGSSAPAPDAPIDSNASDEFTKAFNEFQAVTDEMNGGKSSETDSLASQNGELSEELRALGPDEATDRALDYLRSDAVAQHGKTAILLLHKAADAGNARAMCTLYICYYHGLAVTEDKAKGLSWLQKSAEAGEPNGMYVYSIAIRNGEYDGMGEMDGRLWLERSANAGNQDAIAEMKGEQVRALAGLFGALLSGGGNSGRSSGASEHACLGGGFFTCYCDGFEPGGPDIEVDGQRTYSRYICSKCRHSDTEHNR